MTINRRRAPSSAISREKKNSGHRAEKVFAELIGGEIIKGVQKGDVIDLEGKIYSVKTGKKWQIFLYGAERIQNSNYLNILHPSLDAFPRNEAEYFSAREKCISFKESYQKIYGKELTRQLNEESVESALGENHYVISKKLLRDATNKVVDKLYDKKFLENFLREAIFNGTEVDHLAVLDYCSDGESRFHLFNREDVVSILASELKPKPSKAGRVGVDHNVPGQKVLLYYMKTDSIQKNLVELEVRNDSEIHYRQMRFNMYSKDALLILKKHMPTKISSDGRRFFYSRSR